MEHVIGAERWNTLKVWLDVKQRPIPVDLGLGMTLLIVSIVGFSMEFNNKCSSEMRVWLIIQLLFIFMRIGLKQIQKSYVEEHIPNILADTIHTVLRYLEALDLIWFAIGNLFIFNDIKCIPKSPIIFSVSIVYLLSCYFIWMLLCYLSQQLARRRATENVQFTLPVNDIAAQLHINMLTRINAASQNRNNSTTDLTTEESQYWRQRLETYNCVEVKYSKELFALHGDRGSDGQSQSANLHAMGDNGTQAVPNDSQLNANNHIIDNNSNLGLNLRNSPNNRSMLRHTNEMMINNYRYSQLDSEAFPDHRGAIESESDIESNRCAATECDAHTKYNTENSLSNSNDTTSISNNNLVNNNSSASDSHVCCICLMSLEPQQLTPSPSANNISSGATGTAAEDMGGGSGLVFNSTVDVAQRAGNSTAAAAAATGEMTADVEAHSTDNDTTTTAAVASAEIIYDPDPFINAIYRNRHTTTPLSALPTSATVLRRNNSHIHCLDTSTTAATAAVSAVEGAGMVGTSPLIVRYPCHGTHYFHSPCLHRWLKASQRAALNNNNRDSRQVTCPICREPPHKITTMDEFV